MASSAEHTIETAALGRPFGLGMLYDCRRDALIPGITLWENNDLQKNTAQRKQQNSDFNVTASDSIDEKSNSLDVSGSLKLSLLGGLVNVAGSAKYFHDTKKSRKQERLILHYKTTTKYESLTMSHLGRGQVSHPNVFDDGTATHVVTAILYGASAYFMFDRESSNSEDKKQIEGEAKLMMDKLKFLQVNGEASFDMNEEEKSAVENFNCTFHGDFHLPSNPSTFKEAMDVYRQLPKMLGENGEHAVPVKVWLYPLVKLDSKAAKLQRDISNKLITYTSDVIEYLIRTGMRCNDLLKDTSATTFSVIENKLQTFKHNCHHYKLEFVQKLGSVLPSIRGGGQEESALADILKEHEKSPFNSKYLDQWLKQKENESYTMRSFLEQLKKLKVQLDENLDDFLSDLSITNIVSFAFTSIDQPDSSLMKQSHFLTPAGMMSESPESDVLQNRNTEWLSVDTRQIMRRQLQLFEKLKLANSDDTKFVVSSKYDERYPGACIFIYEDGSSEPVPFIPLSKPDTPTTSDASYDRLTVGVSDPDSATVEYRVEFRKRQETEWTSQPVQKEQGTVTLSGLQPDTKYEIRVTAVGKLGYAISSDVVSGLTDISPPTNVDMKEVKANSITLTWRNPPDQQYQSLRVEYRMKQEIEWKSHPVQKNQQTVTLSGLKPDTEYDIRVTAVGTLDRAVSCDAVSGLTDISPPTNVEVNDMKSDSITLTWGNPPDVPYQSLCVEYRMKQESEWKSHSVQKNQETVTLSVLKPDTEYDIRVTAVGKLNSSVSSDVVTAKTTTGPQTNVKVFKEKTTSITKPKSSERVKLDNNRFTPLSSGNPPVYRLNLKTASTGQLNTMVFGEAKHSNTTPNKTIMFVGATGSGKTTLINGIVNYILGVNWEDNWRFKLIDEETNKSQAHSQTSEVTAYQIHHTDEFQVPYSLTIIDTPGFGDTRGIKHDKEITDKIRQFFTNKDGIDAIDAVCFVVQAALARLTHTQRYVFDAILSVFGKNIASNIITLVTFADAKSPPVLDAIKEADIPCAKKTDGSLTYFKFNNSALFANNIKENKDSKDSCDEDNEEDFDYMFWKMGKSSLKKFFFHLSTMETQSLTLTKEVLQERDRLEATVEGMQPLIQKGLSTMEEIRTTQVALDKHKNQIEGNKDFEYEVEVEKPQKFDIPRGQYITNCLQCTFTCHRNCRIPNDEDKSRCVAMGSNGYCTVCPGQCMWNIHYNMSYRFETKRVKEKRTYQNLKAKFEEALGEEMTTKKIMSQLKIEYDQVQEEVVERMNTVNKCLTCLKEIALRPDPLSTPEYIDLMIESEKKEARPGYMERIQELTVVRQKAVVMQNVEQDLDRSGGLQVHESKDQGAPKKESKGIFNKAVNWFKN